MSDLPPLGEIRKLIANTKIDEIERKIRELGSDYQEWYESHKIAAFGYIPPKNVVANHGVEALVKYIDIKLDGGFE